MKAYKKILALALSLILILGILPLEIMAQEESASGTSGEVRWLLEGTVLTISGSGAMADYTHATSLPWGNAITKLVVEDGVTAIGSYAFAGTALEEAILADSITDLSECAFYECTSLKEVKLPDGLQEIGRYSFWGCSALEELALPASLTKIDDFAFAGCTSLFNPILPDTLETIGMWAFWGCAEMNRIEIPNSVKTIGYGAFSDCISLVVAEIGSGVESIGLSAFSDCSALEILSVKEQNPFYRSTGNCLIETATKTLLTGCMHSILPIDGSVTAIADFAFRGCTMQESIHLPDDITVIGKAAFERCTNLEEVWFEGTEETRATLTVGENNELLTGATWHYVDHFCDADCNVCGATRPATDHLYDDFCDPVCNACGNERIPPHRFDNDCDTTCNDCDHTRTVPDHIYDSVCDLSCAECGSTRALPEEAKIYYEFSSENGAITITDFFAPFAGEITVPAQIDGIPVTAITGGTFYGDLVLPAGQDTALSGSIRIGKDATITAETTEGVTLIQTECWVKGHPYLTLSSGIENVIFASEDGVDGFAIKKGNTAEGMQISASISLSVEERIYIKLWLEAEAVDAYQAEFGTPLSWEGMIQIGNESLSLGQGTISGEADQTPYGDYYIVKLSAVPANHFDKAITISGTGLYLDSIKDAPLNLQTLAKVGAESDFKKNEKNLFTALYNYGASATGAETLPMEEDFIRNQANSPLYQLAKNETVSFTGMSLLMGDAVGIRLAGKLVGNADDVTVKVKIDETEVENPLFSKKVNAETGVLYLDFYVNAEHFMDVLEITVMVKDTPVARITTSIKGYTEIANSTSQDPRVLALAQLVQACVNFDLPVIIPDSSGIEDVTETGTIVF